MLKKSKSVQNILTMKISIDILKYVWVFLNTDDDLKYYNEKHRYFASSYYMISTEGTA